jgi:replicative DNA helicase
MTIEAMCEEVRKSRLGKEAKAIADSILDMAERDPIALGLSQATDVSFGSALGRIVTRYTAIKEGMPMSRLTWPWEIMNTMTGGLQDDDYIVLYGRPKSKKSWVMAAMIAHAFLQGVPTLLYTKEMVPDNILQRVAALCLGVPYQELRMGGLGPVHEEDLYRLLEFVRELENNGFRDRLMCLSGQDVPEGGDTIHWLRSKIDKYKPDVVFVDGLYLMSDGSKRPTADWTRVTAISRAARQMQLAIKKPLVCTVQANRRAAQHSRGELDEIAYADALGQDATIAARVIAERVPVDGVETCALVLAGSREFKLHGFRIGGEPATDFSYKGVLTEGDIERAKQGDTSDRESESPKAHAREKRKARAPRGDGSMNDGSFADDVQQAMGGVDPRTMSGTLLQ